MSLCSCALAIFNKQPNGHLSSLTLCRLPHPSESHREGRDGLRPIACAKGRLKRSSSPPSTAPDAPPSSRRSDTPTRAAPPASAPALHPQDRGRASPPHSPDAPQYPSPAFPGVQPPPYPQPAPHDDRTTIGP